MRLHSEPEGVRDDLALIHATGRILAGERDEAALLQHVCALVAHGRAYRTVLIGIAQDDGRVKAVASNREDALALFEGADIRWDEAPEGQGAVGHALRSGEPVVRRIADASLPRWNQIASELGITHALAVPFRLVRERAVLVAYSGEPEAFGETQVETLRELTAQIAQAVENIRMREALEAERDRANHAEQRLSALWKIGSRVRARPGAAEEIAREIVSEGVHQLGMEFGYVASIDGRRMRFDIINGAPAAGPDHGPIVEAATVDLTGTYAERVVDERLSVAFRHGREGDFIGTPFYVAEGLRVLCFGVHGARVDRFTDQDIRYVELLASVLSQTLDHADVQKRMEYLQQHDPLTGLHNRDHFNARLATLLAARGQHVALVLVDTDKYQQLLDEHGPESGDEIMLELAARITHAKGPSAELFRYRADSFAIVVTDRRPEEVHFLAERCIAAVRMPFRVSGAEIEISASIGIAIAPSDSDDPAGLTVAAATALRRAKRAGHGQFRYYNELLDERFGRRRLLAEELHTALRHDELRLYFQPIVHLRSGKAVAAEGLLRWHHPRRGILGATEFVGLAEESTLINEIGSWVFLQAARQAKAWKDEGREIVIAINLSARQFNDPTLLEAVEHALRVSGSPPELIEFEVTESIAMRDPAAAAYTMGCFRDLGLRIALDDFGTGHSSLAYLRNFPIDIIKLDQSFVAGLPQDQINVGIARAVAELARTLGCEVRAEGVEGPQQAEFLRSIGVDSAQGFWIAPALMPGALSHWVSAWPAHSAWREASASISAT